MSSSGYSEYRSDSWVEDDHTNKSTNMKRDKRSEFDRYIFCYNYLIKHLLINNNHYIMYVRNVN